MFIFALIWILILSLKRTESCKIYLSNNFNRCMHEPMQTIKTKSIDKGRNNISVWCHILRCSTSIFQIRHQYNRTKDWTTWIPVKTGCELCILDCHQITIDNYDLWITILSLQSLITFWSNLISATFYDEKSTY
jgi:hypothetical protein